MQGDVEEDLHPRRRHVVRVDLPEFAKNTRELLYRGAITRAERQLHCPFGLRLRCHCRISPWFDGPTLTVRDQGDMYHHRDCAASPILTSWRDGAQRGTPKAPSANT